MAMVGGANPHETDQDLMNAVMRKAQEHQITLAPEQITCSGSARRAHRRCTWRPITVFL